MRDSFAPKLLTVEQNAHAEDVLRSTVYPAARAASSVECDVSPEAALARLITQPSLSGEDAATAARAVSAVERDASPEAALARLITQPSLTGEDAATAARAASAVERDASPEAALARLITQPSLTGEDAATAARAASAVERCCSQEQQLARLIIKESRLWRGTPFHHRASLKGVGTDCLGLIRGVWREIYGAEPEPLPNYAPDWAEATGRETMRDAATRHLIPVAQPRPGDVLLFRMKPGGPARHAGILAQRQGTLTLIHARPRHGVAEVPYDRQWRHKMAAAFRFPPI